jgi:hypothetical protein
VQRGPWYLPWFPRSAAARGDHSGQGGQREGVRSADLQRAAGGS